MVEGLNVKFVRRKGGGNSAGWPMLIYLITCTKNGKRYVGLTTKTLEWRWARHIVDSRHPRGLRISPLHKAIVKHGPEFFTREVIEICSSVAEMKLAEMRCIVMYETGAPLGYNVTIGGDGSFGTKWSTTRRKRMARGAKTRGAKIRKTWNEGSRKNEAGNRMRERASQRSPEEKRELAAKGCNVSQSYRQSEEYKIKNGKMSKAKWQDPDYRKRTLAAQRAGHLAKKLRQDSA